LTGELLEVAELRFDTINAYGWFGGDDRPARASLPGTSAWDRVC